MDLTESIFAVQYEGLQVVRVCLVMAWNPEDVISSPGSTDPNLLKTLALSDELERAIQALLDPQTYELASDEPNFVACFEACQLAMEHGRALRALVGSQFDSTAAAVLRVQFEALTRAHWAAYAASEDELDALTAPLSEGAEKAASNLPMASAMIKAMRGKGPLGMHEAFEDFRTIVLSTLNAFVHAGQPTLRLHIDGYPPEILDRLLRYSNAMQTMAGMTMANLTGNPTLQQAMGIIQKPFEACLPHLLRPTAERSSSTAPPAR